MTESKIAKLEQFALIPEDNYWSSLFRMKTPTGWLVAMSPLVQGDDGEGSCFSTSLVFVPDPEHKWEEE